VAAGYSQLPQHGRSAVQDAGQTPKPPADRTRNQRPGNRVNKLGPSRAEKLTAGQCEQTMPADERAIRLYLASGMIRGIGPQLASAIVDVFCDQTLKVIDAEPQRLLAVHGIGQVRLGRVTAAWQEQKVIAGIPLRCSCSHVTSTVALHRMPRKGHTWPGLATHLFTESICVRPLRSAEKTAIAPPSGST
jgi:hypothetical protein